MNDKQTVFVTWFCVFLMLSCQFTNIQARKVSSPRKPATARPSTDPKYSNSHNEQAKLSYPNYNSAPNSPSHPQPVAVPPPAPPPLPPKPDTKPIGWNVQQSDGNVQKQTVHNTNSAPYPNQPQQAAPPPYTPQGGAPPAYSPNSNFNSDPHAAPPSYQQHAPPQYSAAPAGGFPQQHGGFPQQQGGFPQQQGGFPQQQGGFPQQQGGFPQQQGGYPVQQGGYPVQQGGFQPQGGYPAGQPYPVAVPVAQSSGSNTLQHALLAGVGGLALYGALKPSEGKTVIINNGVEQKPGEATTAAPAAPAAPAASAAPAAPAAPAAVPAAPLAPVVAAAPAENSTPTPLATAAPASSAVPLAPVEAVTNPTAPVTVEYTTGTPLAPFPVTPGTIVTMAPPGIPPYSGSTQQYEQLTLNASPSEASSAPLASFPSQASSVPLAPFPSSQPPPMCAPGQNPYDPLSPCTPLTVVPMYVTPSTTVAMPSVPVASSTNQNLQAPQSALKSNAVSQYTKFTLILIPLLTLLVA